MELQECMCMIDVKLKFCLNVCDACSDERCSVETRCVEISAGRFGW